MLKSQFSYLLDKTDTSWGNFIIIGFKVPLRLFHLIYVSSRNSKIPLMLKSGLNLRLSNSQRITLRIVFYSVLRICFLILKVKIKPHRSLWELNEIKHLERLWKLLNVLQKTVISLLIAHSSVCLMGFSLATGGKWCQYIFFPLLSCK